MTNLDETRKKINLIDQKMIDLFKERMNLVSDVLEYKKERNLAVFDKSREEELLKKNLELLNDKSLEEYYKIFFEGVLSSSKKYQEDNYE